MTKPVFVDSSAWLAATDKRDHSHAVIKNWLDASRGRRLVTTSFVLDETLTLIRRRLDHESAVKFGKAIFASSVAQLVQIASVDIESAWRIFQKYKDQDFSFTDCTSFAVMMRLKMTEALALDQHFAVMGFTLVA